MKVNVDLKLLGETHYTQTTEKGKKVILINCFNTILLRNPNEFKIKQTHSTLDET